MVLSPATRREVLTEYEANGFRFPDSALAQVAGPSPRGPGRGDLAATSVRIMAEPVYTCV